MSEPLRFVYYETNFLREKILDLVYCSYELMTGKNIAHKCKQKGGKLILSFT